MNYALMQNAHVSVPTFDGLRGLAGPGEIVESDQVVDGATIEWSVDGALALGSDAVNTLTDTLNGSLLLRSVVVGGPGIPLISGTLNITAISKGVNGSSLLIAMINRVASWSFSFDATQARTFIQEPAPGLEILSGAPGWSATHVLHQGKTGSPLDSVPTWLIVGGVALGAIVLLMVLTR